MYRNIINDLAAWFEETKRRILYLKGASGVGKTWTIRDFSTAFFASQIYIDVRNTSEIITIISNCIKDAADIPDRIHALDEYLYNKYGTFSEADTILIFDGLQDIYGADVFFHEYARKHRHYSICLVASTMQISEYEYHHKDVFKILRMRPMTFEEYMIAKKATPFLAAIQSSKNKPLNSVEETTLINMLKEYMLVGGMPEIVSTFITTRDYTAVRNMQLEYISRYEKLIKQSASSAMAQRMRRIWRSIPKQLMESNKKFMYRLVEENARAREYSEAVQALCNLGLVRKLPRLKDGILPLEEHVDYKSFELFLIDHGLLRACYGLDMDDNISLEDIMLEKNGAVAEQYVFQELSSKVGNVYYWISGATARVPFVYDGDNMPVPVDIRFVENKKAQNIKTFRSKYTGTEISIKISLSQVYLDNKVLNIPAYGLWNM